MTVPTPPDPNEERLLEHNYDGIQEFDNPLPRWWVALFWASIVFAILYEWNVIPGLGTGPGRIANYEREMQVATVRAAAAEAARPRLVLTGEMIAGFLQDPAALAAGKETFASTCAPCHRADGGGLIGPNLTDDFWLHGRAPMELAHTITVGYPDKGMPTWGQALTPEQIGHVAAYVLSLHDTHPPDPKAPQGEKQEEEAPSAAKAPTR